MLCKTVQILWHNKSPVMSIDVHPACGRVATAGGDAKVNVWRLASDKVECKHAASLTYHEKTVNVVRWSPDGRTLASGGDDGVIYLWRLKEVAPATEDEEPWGYHAILRGHVCDVYDLVWSPNSLSILSGSVDNTARLWNVEKAKEMQCFKEHSNFVQGVAWDPAGKYLVTQSSDRSCNIYTQKKGKGDYSCVQNISYMEKETNDRNEAAGSEDAEGGQEKEEKRMRLYVDETAQTFFRRLSWSPDGSVLVTPAGQAADPEAGRVPTAHLFSRRCFARPSMHFPGGDKTIVSVRFSPVYYRLRADGPQSYLDLPYRMVFAVASMDSVMVYDTQHMEPIAFATNLHFVSITDLSWSGDGRVLGIASADGYCSFMTFNDDEIGERVPEAECPGRKEAEKPEEKEEPLSPAKDGADLVTDPEATVTNVVMIKRLPKDPPAGEGADKKRRRIVPEAVSVAPREKAAADGGETPAPPTEEAKPKAVNRITPTVISTSTVVDGKKRITPVPVGPSQPVGGPHTTPIKTAEEDAPSPAKAQVAATATDPAENSREPRTAVEGEAAGAGVGGASVELTYNSEEAVEGADEAGMDVDKSTGVEPVLPAAPAPAPVAPEQPVTAVPDSQEASPAPVRRLVDESSPEKSIETTPAKEVLDPEHKTVPNSAEETTPPSGTKDAKPRRKKAAPPASQKSMMQFFSKK